MVRESTELSTPSRSLICGAELPARSNMKAPDDRYVLNLNSPPNPFTPTTKPDWILVTGAAEHRRKSRGMNKIGELNHGKLASPFEPESPSQSNNTRSLVHQTESRKSSQALMPPAPSNVSRKPAPPIPKKPALLNRSSGLQDDPGGDDAKQDRRTFPRPRPGSRTQMIDVRDSFILKQQSSFGLSRESSSVHRDDTVSTSRHQQAIHKQEPTESTGPPLPPRPTNATSTDIDGLMDNDDGGASTILALQPMRRL